MDLFFHLSIHIIFGLLAGFITWRFWGRPKISFAAGLLGSFFIDFDHFLDYFLAFGFNFRLDYFINGYQFLKSGQTYILLHGWEYAIILLLGAFLLKRKFGLRALFLSLGLGIFFHLLVDLSINDGMTLRGYSLIYRLKNNFQIEKIVTPEHYEDDKLRRKTIFYN